VSAPALALAFFDPAHEIHGTARSGATILFEGTRPTALAEGPAFTQDGDRWRARLPDSLSLEAEPASEVADLGDVTVRLCRVRGEAAGRTVDCFGTLSETSSAPRWEDLDALRSISAIVDENHALLALARRPRGAVGHGHERVQARLIDDGTMRPVEEARISTVYDGDGRQRSAGVELWMQGEEFPRRGSGVVVAGSSLDLEEIHVHAAIFQWRLEGHDAIGAYELMVRSEPPAAA